MPILSYFTVVGSTLVALLLLADVTLEKKRASAKRLAAFTLIATFIANRFWEVAPPDRFMAENGFFEHLGLVGGFLRVA